MKFLHVSDFHLGKPFYGHDLIEDQAYMLDAVLDLLRAHKVDALCIAGDVYDRAVPPVQAVQLFDAFVSRALAENPRLRIALIPGNHDSGERLGWCAGLLARAGLHIQTSLPDAPAFVLPFALPSVRPQDEPAPAVTAPAVTAPAATALPRKSVAVWAMPFLGMALFGPEADGLRSQADLMEAALARIRPHLADYGANVLVAHCFVAGAAPAESERSFVGLAEQIGAAVFAGFDYVALGHLHRPQNIASYKAPSELLRAPPELFEAPSDSQSAQPEALVPPELFEAPLDSQSAPPEALVPPEGCGAPPTLQYCGSPLAYSFGEAGQARGALVVEIGPAKAPKAAQKNAVAPRPIDLSVDFVPIKPLHPLRVLRGSFDELRQAAKTQEKESAHEYVSIRLTDAQPVAYAMEPLREVYPNLLTLEQDALKPQAQAGQASVRLLGAEGEGAQEGPPAGSEEAVRMDFLDFHAALKGISPDAATVSLFEAILKEAEDASRQA